MLHSQGLVHLDLKTPNLLLDRCTCPLFHDLRVTSGIQEL